VGYTVTLSDYVPENQNGRLEVLAEAEFLIGPTLRPRPSAPPHSPDEARRALRELLTSLDAIQAAGSGEALRAATSLHSTLVRFLARLEREPERTPEMLDALETSLVGSLPERLRLLRTALGTRAVRLCGWRSIQASTSAMTPLWPNTLLRSRASCRTPSARAT
jgi:hypothetical protein